MPLDTVSSTPESHLTLEQDLSRLLQTNAQFRKRFGPLATRVDDLLSGAAEGNTAPVQADPSTDAHRSPAEAVPTRAAAVALATHELRAFVESTQHLG